MKHFFARVFAMHPFLLTAAVCLIPLTVAGTRWAWMAPGASERAAKAAANELSVNVVNGLTTWADKSLMPPVNSMVTTVNGLPAMSRDLINEQATGFRRDLFPLAYAGLGIVNRRTGDVLRLADGTRKTAEEQLIGLRGDLAPVLEGAAKLETTYAAVPAQLGARLEPAYADVEAEIRCRKRDAFGVERGYGECIKGRVVGVMGEALGVGAIFRQHFPGIATAVEKMSGSWAGISNTFDKAADKYLLPRPMTLKEKFLAVVKVGVAIFIAALRGGAF